MEAEEFQTVFSIHLFKSGLERNKHTDTEIFLGKQK